MRLARKAELHRPQNFASLSVILAPEDAPSRSHSVHCKSNRGRL